MAAVDGEGSVGGVGMLLDAGGMGAGVVSLASTGPWEGSHGLWPLRTGEDVAALLALRDRFLRGMQWGSSVSVRPTCSAAILSFDLADSATAQWIVSSSSLERSRI